MSIRNHKFTDEDLEKANKRGSFLVLRFKHAIPFFKLSQSDAIAIARHFNLI